MQRVMTEIDDPDLRAYIIFVPTMRADSEAEAATRASEFDDDRVTYFWDPDIISGGTWGETYDLDSVAWDVYLLYGAGKTWKDQPTRADFAMTGHRTIAKKLPKLDVEPFIEEARKLLEE